MTSGSSHHRAELHAIAQQVMRARGLEPDFPPRVVAETASLSGPAPGSGPDIRDLRALPWCSIDNDDSRDLDQLTACEALPGGDIRALVAVADVDALVARGSATDAHAERNTTSIYTAGGIFPMLPERLSTDLTSLNAREDRLALVIEMVVRPDGTLSGSDVYRALVTNHAQLAYSAVGAWLEGASDLPAAISAVPGLDAQLRLQDDATLRLCERRHEQGALDLETRVPRPVFAGDAVVGLHAEPRNRAHRLIEDFMVAANGVTARFLEDRGRSGLRRVVRSPEHWDRIVEVAAEHGDTLPRDPDSGALADFLARQRQAEPERFPDLSLVILKLLGSGEYVVETPTRQSPGHFGLAVRDYMHSTAPNRRFPDLLGHRLLKAALAGQPAPYSDAELARLAEHCTNQEDQAERVERHLRKSAAALLLEPRVGERFDAVVTGASSKGTWVRLLDPPAEGRLTSGARGRTVGDRLSVKLLGVDVERGYVDFAKA